MIGYGILMWPNWVRGGPWGIYSLTLQGILVEPGAARDNGLIHASHKQSHLSLKVWSRRSKIWGHTPLDPEDNMNCRKIQNLMLCVAVAKSTFNPSISFFLNFYWSIVDLHSCVSFRCTAKWISCTVSPLHTNEFHSKSKSNLSVSPTKLA